MWRGGNGSYVWRDDGGYVRCGVYVQQQRLGVGLEPNEAACLGCDEVEQMDGEPHDNLSCGFTHDPNHEEVWTTKLEGDAPRPAIDARFVGPPIPVARYASLSQPPLLHPIPSSSPPLF